MPLFIPCPTIDNNFRYDFKIAPDSGVTPFETYKTYKNLAPTSECQSHCKANKRCTFFTHVTESKDTCQLFSDFHKVTLESNKRGFITGGRESGKKATFIPGQYEYVSFRSSK